MPKTRGMVKTRRQEKRASQSARQEKRDGPAEVKDGVPSVSPRDITSCAFGKEESFKSSENKHTGKAFAKSEDKGNKDEAVKAKVNNVESSASKPEQESIERNEASCSEREKERRSNSDGVISGEQGMELSETRGEETRKDGEDATQKEIATPMEMDAAATTAIATHPKEHIEEKATTSAEVKQAPPKAHKNTGHAPTPAQEPEENGTSSSCSLSKRPRTSRTSTLYLQQTRAHRRALARSRTSLARDKREAASTRELAGLAGAEREAALARLEQLQREREMARRQEVKRVKNRESVEKSRTREMVFEAQVGCEWDELGKENERMAQVVDWFKKENVLKVVRKELVGVRRKRRLGQ